MSKVKKTEYYFRQDAPNFVSIAKFVDDDFVIDYHIQSDSAHNPPPVNTFRCNCPATYKNKNCKHLVWFKGWMQLPEREKFYLDGNAGVFRENTNG